ncbi:DUF6287 domain-containing protein [Streptococcus dentasini]
MKKKITFMISGLTIIILALSIWGIQSQKQDSQAAHGPKTSQTSRSSSRSKNSSASKSSSQTAPSPDKSENSGSYESKDSKNTNKTEQGQSAEPAFDYHALASGDFSSLAGTWSDANGRTLIIAPDGSANILGTPASITVTRDGKGEALMMVTYEDGTSLGILMYSAGERIPDRHFQSGADTSDNSRNRLVTAASDVLDEGGSDQFKNQVLYKTSADYEGLN